MALPALGGVADPVMRRMLTAYAAAGRPFAVHLDITHRCDLRCRHCYLEGRTRDALSTDEWLDVIRQLHKFGVFKLTFGGGEPLLRSDFPDLLALARALRFELVVKTHGGLIDAAWARELRRLAVRRVDVSVYSPRAQIHESITGRDGSLAATLAGIGHLRDAGVAVQLVDVVMDANQGDADAVQNLAREVAAGFAMSPGLYAGNRGSDLDDSLGLDDEGLRAFAARERAAAPTEAVDPSPAGARVPPHALPLCGAAILGAAIDPDGEVHPCVMWPESAGSIRRAPFADLWDAPLMRTVRETTHGDRAGCEGCALRGHCTPCMVRSVQETGDRLRPARFDCRLAEARRALDGADPAQPDSEPTR